LRRIGGNVAAGSRVGHLVPLAVEDPDGHFVVAGRHPLAGVHQNLTVALSDENLTLIFSLVGIKKLTLMTTLGELIVLPSRPLWSFRTEYLM